MNITNRKEHKKEKPPYRIYYMLSACICFLLLKEQESKPTGKGFRLFLRKAKRVCRLSLGYLLCRLFEIAEKYMKL
nr:MAG TPA: hypothetical protein [Caudoviricetes sp.]